MPRASYSSSDVALMARMMRAEAEGEGKRLAKQTLDYWRQFPAMHSLWYFNPHAPCPSTWYDQPPSGQYKQHCYYEPKECPGAYSW